MGFWTYENSENQISYLFNINHFLIIMIALVIIIFFSMYVCRQKFKFQKAFIIGSTILLIIFEVIRIVWRYNYLKFNEQDLGFFNIVQFDFFTLSLYISIPILIINGIIKKEHTNKSFGLSFVFSVAMLAGIISLIYPSAINSNFEFYHVSNLIFILSRSLVIMLGLSLAFCGWVSTSEFLDLYRGLISLCVFGIIAMIVGFIGGVENNIMYINYYPLFDSLGIYLSFPFQYLVLGIFLFIFQIVLYLPFRIHSAIKYRKH